MSLNIQPIKLPSASQSALMAHDISEAFSKIPSADQDKVYFFMWKIKGEPSSVPNYGMHAFHGTNGQSATDAERREAIRLYVEEAEGNEINQKFSLLPVSNQDRVYFHLWELKGKPAFHDFGKHAFHGTNGQSATPAEKREAIKRCQDEITQAKVDQAFAKIPAESHDRVYFFLSKIKKEPASIPDFGKHAFHGTNGFNSTPTEKLAAITAYEEELAEKQSPKPAEKQPPEKITKIEKAFCSICQDELGAERVTAACKHFFHKDCLTPWLAKHDTCPECRYKFSKPIQQVGVPVIIQFEPTDKEGAPVPCFIPLERTPAQLKTQELFNNLEQARALLESGAVTQEEFNRINQNIHEQLAPSHHGGAPALVGTQELIHNLEHAEELLAFGIITQEDFNQINQIVHYQLDRLME